MFPNQGGRFEPDHHHPQTLKSAELTSVSPFKSAANENLPVPCQEPHNLRQPGLPNRNCNGPKSFFGACLAGKELMSTVKKRIRGNRMILTLALISPIRL